MKPTFKTLVLGASVLAFSMGTTANINQAHATEINETSKYVKYINLGILGQAPVINIQNASGSKAINALNLQVQESEIEYTVSPTVHCKSGAETKSGTMYFGPLVMTGSGGFSDNGTLHKDKNIYYSDLGKKITESAQEAFTIPLNKIKNGHPLLRVDALEELEKARQAFNGTDLEFYQQDHELVIKRPLSFGALCAKKSNHNKVTGGFETQMGVIQIKYKGDPDLTDGVLLNAQLENNMPNQVQQNEDLIPFKLNDVQFNVNTPHYTGKCLPDKNPKIRMHFTVAGGKKGQIDLRVKAVGGYAAAGDKYFETEGIIKDPKQGGGILEFNFPLIEKLSSDKYTWMAKADNKTHNHGMQIEARYKNFDGSNEWSEWQEFDTETFKHRCTPQIKGGLVGNGGIQGYNGNNGGNGPAINGTLQAVPQNPPPTLPGNIQAQPKPPANIGNIQAQPVDPSPTPKLNKR